MLQAILDETNLSVAEQVNRILTKAIKIKASDVHFEFFEESLRVRFRKDGLLYELCHFNKKQAEFIVTRLKVLGNLDISEHRLPQDGRFFIPMDQQKIDCRISTCPTIKGEKVVIRLLNTKKDELEIEKLGMEDFQQHIFLKTIQQPQGMILVTGPTGCGKTITLYAALNTINQIEKNILTVEDPIEVELEGINQVAVNTKIGLTFAKTLRAFLRQDPDIIMVGEIRDEETASIAIRAAQTGHLVFSTLHTNSALESLHRLMNMGIEPYNIASSLSLIISQRLVRMNCLHCNKAKTLCKNQSNCSFCYEGYLGRIGLFELLLIDENLKNLITDKQLNEIKNYVLEQGWMSLKESGLRKIQNGLTSDEELKRVLMCHSSSDFFQ